MNWAFIPSVLLTGLAVAGTILLFIHYCGLSRGRAVLATGITMVVSVAAGGWRAYEFEELRRTASRHRNSDEEAIVIVSTGIFVFLLLPFAIRLYGKWLDGKTTVAERTPGAVGIRAWLSPANIAMSLLLSVAAWQAFGVSPLLVLTAACGLILTWPLLHAPAEPSRLAAPESLSSEREKVLGMLEAGKITAEESAELLNALGATTAHSITPRAPLTNSGRLVLIGAALVLIGFFLPWFEFSPGAEVARVFDQFRGSGLPMPDVPNMKMQPTLSVAGGSIGNGLGWAVLLLAGAAALLPYWVPAMDLLTQRTVRLLCAGAGTIILLYLTTQNLRAVSIGVVLAAAGYGLEWLGLWREQAAIPAALPHEQRA